MFVFPAHADDLKTAINAVKAKFKKAGDTFSITEKECKRREQEPWGEYLLESQTMGINSTIKAILLTSAICYGNGIKKTLVIVEKNKANIIDGLGMSDNNFLGNMSHIDGRTIVFNGNKWKDDDSHCCPSQKAELRFNIDTKQQSLTVVSASSNAASDADIDKLTSYAVFIGRAIACGANTSYASGRVGAWMDKKFPPGSKDQQIYLPIFIAGVKYHAEQQKSGHSPDSCSTVLHQFNLVSWP